MNKNKERLIEWLKVYDDYLVNKNETSTLVIVGGSGLILGGYIDRATKDIDSISKIDLQHTRDLDKVGIDINSMCAIFHHTFYGWHDEVINLNLGVDFKNLTVKTLSLEMILASKFFTRLFDRDITDVALKGVYIDGKKLERLVINIWKHVISLDKYKMVEREMEIVELYRTMRWDYENSDIKKLINNKY